VLGPDFDHIGRLVWSDLLVSTRTEAMKTRSATIFSGCWWAMKTRSATILGFWWAMKTRSATILALGKQ